MWRPEPPGWAWLLRHEVRLLWRGFGGLRSRILALLGLVVIAAAHFAGWAFMRNFDLDAVLRVAPLPMITLTTILVLMAVAAAFGLAVNTLFDRGDLDLLLSSPVPIANVYAVRGVAVALGSVAGIAAFVLPIANMGPVHGHWETLLAYPVLAAFGLASAALGFAGTLALVRLLGLRRARVAAQVTGALIGAALVLGMQLETLLPRERRDALQAWTRSDEGASWLGASSPLAWPLRAAFGDAGLAGLVVVGAVAFFVAVIALTWRAFAAAAVQSPATSRARTPSGPGRPFRAGLARVVVGKELALLARDPALIAKSLLNVLYLVPVFLVLVRNSQPPHVVAAAVVALAASLAGNLAWITVSAEESPDLLASAPVSAERLRWLKVLAAVLPVAAICAPFLAWYLARSFWGFLVVAAAVSCAIASSAVVQVWLARPAARRDLAVRHKQNPLVNLADLMSTMGWAMACLFALAGSAWAAAGVAAGLVSPLVAWLSARDRRAVMD